MSAKEIEHTTYIFAYASSQFPVPPTLLTTVHFVYNFSSKLYINRESGAVRATKNHTRLKPDSAMSPKIHTHLKPEITITKLTLNTSGSGLIPVKTRPIVILMRRGRERGEWGRDFQKEKIRQGFHASYQFVHEK